MKISYDCKLTKEISAIKDNVNSKYDYEEPRKTIYSYLNSPNYDIEFNKLKKNL